MKNSRVQFYFVWCWLAVVGSGSCLSGRKCEQYLSFVADAGTNPEDKHDISEPALFRFLLKEKTMKQLDEAGADIPEMLDVLKDLDKESKVLEFEMYQSSKTGEAAVDYTFVVFKTTSATEGDDWWSLEKNNLECIVMQRSGNKDDVKNKLHGAERIKVEPIIQGLKGKGTIKDLLVLLWSYQTIEENLNIIQDKCQAFFTLVSQQMTEIGYEYQGDVECSPLPEDHEKPEIVDYIHHLAFVTKWDPFIASIYLENPKLVDKILENANYDIDVLRERNLYALQFAISFSKPKMLELLLQPPLNADPTVRDPYGRDALEMAATYAVKTEIIDLLLTHDRVDVDDVNEAGHTALHAAASASNVMAVKHLINRGANPKIVDKNGLSPLHVAAVQRDGNPVIDLLLEAQKVKGLGDVNDVNILGWTALYYAAVSSNEITAEHLIKKGADPNRRSNHGLTPLQAATYFAEDIKIIDVLLRNLKAINGEDALVILGSGKLNKHGLDDQIVARLVEKRLDNIKEFESLEREPSDKLTPNTETISEFRINLLHLTSFEGESTDPIDAILRTGKIDINGVDSVGHTPLHWAIMGRNPALIVPHLLRKGADPNVAEMNGVTPLHYAARYAKNLHIVELLLNHPDVIVNRFDKAESNELHYARVNQHGLSERIANLLKEKGVVERENKRDAMRQAVDRALRESDVEMIHTLIENGFNFSSITWNKLNVNALHMASFFAKTTDLIDAILDTGEFDINGVDDEGLTPISHALMGNNPTINFLHLVHRGADSAFTEKKGVVIFNQSKKNAEQIEILEQLLEETVEVGYCVNPERYIFAPNVCRVNSYIFYMKPRIYKKEE